MYKLDKIFIKILMIMVMMMMMIMMLCFVKIILNDNNVEYSSLIMKACILRIHRILEKNKNDYFMNSLVIISYTLNLVMILKFRLDMLNS